MINRLFVAVLFYFNIAATLGAVSFGVALAGVMPDLPPAFRLGSFGAAAALAYLSLRMARAGVHLLASR